MDNQQIPDPSAMLPPAGAAPLPTPQSSEVAPSAPEADVLTRASAAVEAVVQRTMQSPSERLRQIANIKQHYIYDQYGVNIYE